MAYHEGEISGIGGTGPGSGEYAPYEAASERAPFRWLASTRRLQEEAYGHVAAPEDVAATARSLRENLMAALLEMAEVGREFSWKPWAHDEPYYERQRVLEELVDVSHFVANMLVAVGVTDDEWEAAYRAKQRQNLVRQMAGYKVKEKR